MREKSKLKKKKVKVVHEWKRHCVCMRKPEDVTAGEYASFFTILLKYEENHSSVKHFSVKYKPVFHAMLFVFRTA